METASDTARRRREVIERLFTPDGKIIADLEDTPPLNSADVAALFRMSERTIRVWARKKKLPHMRTLGGGRIMYPADKIAALYTENYVDVAVRSPSAIRDNMENTRTFER